MANSDNILAPDPGLVRDTDRTSRKIEASRFRFRIALFCGAALAAASTTAWGADFDRGQNQSVLDRASAAYAPDGVDLGPFRLFPTLDVDEMYNSNIFATQTNDTGDFITTIRPQFKLNTSMRDDTFSIYGQGAIARYADHSTEDSDTGTLGGSAQINAQHDVEIDLRVEHQHDVEPRYDPSVFAGSAVPTLYDLQIESLQVSKTINRLRLTTAVENDRYDYGVVPQVAGPALNENYRDQNAYTIGQTVEYAISPATALYAAFIYNGHGYDRSELLTGFNQNSNGYQANFGANFDITHLIRGQFALGYLSENAHDSRLPDYSGLSVSVNMDYFVTPIITLHLISSRSVNASGLVGAPEYLSSNVQIGADYELRRNLVLSASAAGGWDTYNGIDRNDTRQSYNASAKYYMNRNIAFVLQYQRMTLDSAGTGAGTGYRVNQVTFSIVLAR
ncbi:MAG: outer membrane beta-barrel protein [Caulobacteraceae bacterium]